MELNSCYVSNPLKKLIVSDRRRRSFVADKLDMKPERLKALLKAPEHLSCLEAFKFCELYQLHPEVLFDLYMGEKTPTDFRRPGRFDYARFYSSEYQTHKLWHFIETLRAEFEWSEERIAKCCGLSLNQYHYFAGRWRSFPFLAAMKLARTLEEDVVQLHDVKFDIEAFIKRFGPHGEAQAHLPARFEVGAGSKMRLLDNALDYLRERFGEAFPQIILKSLEIPEGALRFKDKNISILTFKELHRKCIALGGDKLTPYYLGKNNQYNKANRMMFRQYLNFSNYREFYLSACKDVAPLVDRNFFYDVIESSHKHVRIRAVAQPERHKALGERFLNRNMALYIYGHFAVSPRYVDWPESQADFSSFVVDTLKSEFYFTCRFG